MTPLYAKKIGEVSPINDPNDDDKKFNNKNKYKKKNLDKLFKTGEIPPNQFDHVWDDNGVTPSRRKTLVGGRADRTPNAESSDLFLKDIKLENLNNETTNSKESNSIFTNKPKIFYS
jgi:hypothetical protein